MNVARNQAGPIIDWASTDLALMARVSGVLYICGAWLVVISLALPHPMTTKETGEQPKAPPSVKPTILGSAVRLPA